jgi:NAD+ kinase
MNKIGILARPDLEEAASTIRDLATWLDARGVEPCFDGATARLAGLALGRTVSTGRELAATCDGLVVLGGDGTLLAASRHLEREIPVLGVNFGSLGFLTEIALRELFPTLEALLSGKYAWEDRRLLRTCVRRRGQPDAVANVLNDVVVAKAGGSRIIELDVTVDDLFVSAFRADGLIVSSPTGSTAYNLAAGGPILHPSLAAVVLTPICPHMLTNRPLVITDEARVEVRLRAARDVEVRAALDGQQTFILSDQDAVVITRSERCLRLVKAAGRDYYEVLRTKLKWGEPPPRRSSAE